MTATITMAIRRHHRQTMALTPIIQAHSQDRDTMPQMSGQTEVPATTCHRQDLSGNRNRVTTTVQRPQERNIHPGYAVPAAPITGVADRNA